MHYMRVPSFPPRLAQYLSRRRRHCTYTKQNLFREECSNLKGRLATLCRVICMSKIFCFEVHAFDCSIRVETACFEAHTILERYTFPALPRAAGWVDKADIFIRVVRDVGQFRLL